jgi:hypothetical protein
MCEGCATDYVTYTSAFVAVNYHPCFHSRETNFKNVKRHSVRFIHLVAHQSDQTVRGEGGMKLLLLLFPGALFCDTVYIHT